jgi:hypothetical protein
MGVAARGVELEGGVEHGPALPETLDEPCGMCVRRHPGRHALLAFQDTGGAGQPVAGEIGGEEAVGGGLGSVELLGVRGVAEKLPEPGRLRPGRPEGVEHSLSVGAEQACDGGRRGERARRAGGVEDLVVGATEKGPDPDTGLVAHDRCGYEVPARGPGLLGSGERGGENYGRRVEDGFVVDVVLLYDVRGCSVHQRGEEGSGPPARDQYLARTFVRAHRLREPFQCLDWPGVPSRKGRRDPVQKELLRSGHDLFGEIFESQVGERRGQLAAYAGGRRGHDLFSSGVG